MAARLKCFLKLLLHFKTQLVFQITSFYKKNQGYMHILEKTHNLVNIFIADKHFTSGYLQHLSSCLNNFQTQYTM